jgi:hypothetical protein
MNIKSRSIKQIMPIADGFVLVWYNDAPNKDGDWFFTTRLFGLALVDYPDPHDGVREDRIFPIDDMGGFLDFIEEESWQRILHKDEITPELKQWWNDDAKEKAEREAKRKAAKERKEQ